MLYQRGYGPLEGARFGASIGLFAVCSFVLHNHVNLNIGWPLTWKQAIAYFVEWTIVGTVIGWIYRGAVMRDAGGPHLESHKSGAHLRDGLIVAKVSNHCEAPLLRKLSDRQSLK